MSHHAGLRRGNAEFDQHHYVRAMASKFSVEKTSTTPAAAGVEPLPKDEAPQIKAETEEMRVTPYREVVGALVWAAAMTRPDVAYDAHQLGNVNDNPGPVHWGAAKGHYNTCSARGTLGSPTEERRGRAQKLSAWVDADFITCPDTRRSISGGVVMLGGGA